MVGAVGVAVGAVGVHVGLGCGSGERVCGSGGCLTGRSLRGYRAYLFDLCI